MDTVLAVMAPMARFYIGHIPCKNTVIEGTGMEKNLRCAYWAWECRLQ